jgi:hypothetical protein
MWAEDDRDKVKVKRDEGQLWTDGESGGTIAKQL